MFFLGLIGVFGVMMYAAVTGGNPGAFIDLPSLIVVVVASFFAALAMSKGKFDNPQDAYDWGIKWINKYNEKKSSK